MSTPKPQTVDVVDKGSGPDRIYDAATAFRQSAALFAACRLGLCIVLLVLAESGNVTGGESAGRDWSASDSVAVRRGAKGWVRTAGDQSVPPSLESAKSLPPKPWVRQTD